MEMELAAKEALRAFLAPREGERVRVWKCRGKSATTVGIRYLDGEHGGAELVIAYPGRSGSLDFTSEYGEAVSNRYIVDALIPQ